MHRPTDTIAALATPAGTSALAVVRASGPGCLELARVILGRTGHRGEPGQTDTPEIPERRAQLVDYVDARGQVLDSVLVTVFHGPRSYTGEDSLELSCHGNPFIAGKILDDLSARGCRPAGPGEFTQRAFLNGRIDLSQAEAVMDVIHARSERALAAAQRQLQGALGRHMARLVDDVLKALARIEAYIDFPDEDLPAEDRARVTRLVGGVRDGADRLLATTRSGDRLRHGFRTVILGDTNAGKSSLLNRLIGRDRALVSPEPGTTRDFIEEFVRIGPHGFILVDTAGLNPDPGQLERLGIEKTHERVAEADLLVRVVDATLPHPPLPADLAARFTADRSVLVLNKIDLLQAASDPASPDASSQPPPNSLPSQPPAPTDRPASVAVSALTGAGIDTLERTLISLAEDIQITIGDDVITINHRHSHALGEARTCLDSALDKLLHEGPVELIASDLRGALDALGQIAGRVDNERMLDHLFSTFCIGK